MKCLSSSRRRQLRRQCHWLRELLRQRRQGDFITGQSDREGIALAGAINAAHASDSEQNAHGLHVHLVMRRIEMQAMRTAWVHGLVHVEGHGEFGSLRKLASYIASA